MPDSLQNNNTALANRVAELEKRVQVEEALECIRIRATEMQHSNELPDVALLVWKQVEALGITEQISDVAINIYDREAGNFECWYVAGYGILDTDNLKLGVASYPLDVAWIVREAIRLENEGHKDFTVEAEGAQLEEWIEDMVAVIDPSLAEDLKAMNLERSYFYACTFSSGNICINSFEPIQASLHQMLRRITDAFELAYRRFVDLKKAEAQPRQAKIEAALERVRARTLEMRHSIELVEVATVLLSELNRLQLEELESCTVWIYDGQHSAELWFALKDPLNPDAEVYQGHSVFDLTQTEISRQILSFFQSDRSAASLTVQGNDFIEWASFVLSHFPDLASVEMHQLENPRGYINLAAFSHGAIGATAYGELSEENKHVLKRSASAFELAYRRFLDLKRAEEDLERIKIEKRHTEKALDKLRTTQAQLIQAEKLASLGQLTAGIAHEIKNPLNFVNNFASLISTLVEDLRSSPDSRIGDEQETIDMLAMNAEKINEHGKRADNIVQSMMRHASGATGERRKMEVNVLVEEYVNLAYHGMRSQHPGFNVQIERQFDELAGDVDMVPQEIGQVLVNLFNNAFDAMLEQQKRMDGTYQARLVVSTASGHEGVTIRVTDNGPGIPDSVRDKVFEPFFTTKPTGSGTGLGLSLSYDIVTQGHGGKLEVTSQEGEGATFVVQLPVEEA